MPEVNTQFFSNKVLGKNLTKIPNELKGNFVTELSLQLINSYSQLLSKYNNELAINIENFTTDTILDTIEDWWNNEGGSGTLSILVPSGEYNVENNIRVINYDEFFHEGNLFRKTED